MDKRQYKGDIMSFPKRLTYTEALQQEYAQMYKHSHPDEFVDTTEDRYDDEEEIMMKHFEKKKRRER